MNKRTTILLQSAVWAVLLASPLTFTNHANGLSIEQFLVISMATLIMMVVFYLNYFYMIRRYYVVGSKTKFWTINLSLCVILGIFISIWMEHQIICDVENSNHPKSHEDHSGHGIGLKQVRHRLELSYKGHYQWEQGPSADGKVYRSCITIHY